MSSGGKATSPAPRPRNYSPSEFSAALAECGVSLCADRVRRRCCLPAAHPEHIATLATFPGRHFIPEAELFRLASVPTEASA